MSEVVGQINVQRWDSGDHSYPLQFHNHVGQGTRDGDDAIVISISVGLGGDMIIAVFDPDSEKSHPNNCVAHYMVRMEDMIELVCKHAGLPFQERT